MATPTTGLGFQNFFSATLTGDITASSVDILMDTIPASSQGFLVIEPDSTTAREIIFYTSKTALKVVCTSAADGRGQDDTSASAHSTGAAVIMAPVAGMFEALQDASALSGLVTRLDESTFDFVASGGIWSGDAYASTRNASMTAMVCYIDGRRISISAVTARSFTASKDTYIDVLSAGDGTGTLVYTEVANNAASPALAANSLRIGIIVTGATNIAAAGSVNQGQEDRVLPIASSIPYCFTDSLGNIICPRDPLRRIIGYRRIAANSGSFSAGSLQVVPGLTVPFIADGVRKIRAKFHMESLQSQSVAGSGQSTGITESGAYIATGNYVNNGVNYTQQAPVEYVTTPTAGLHTYSAAVTPGGSTMVVRAVAFLSIEQI